MPPESAGSPGEWLRYAASDLALARVRVSEAVMLETLCFHAQQAIEKAFKAVLIRYRQPVLRTHSIEALLTALAEHTTVPPEFKKAADLTAFATIARYPGDYEPVSEADYADAIALAEMVVDWAKTAALPDT